MTKAKLATTNETTQLINELFPYGRSITGDGVRRTLDRLKVVCDFDIHEIPSGKQVLDWTVPKEWLVRTAYIETMDGKRIADYATNNLHLVVYSKPFSGELSFEELRPKLHTLPTWPKAIPYRTSYYCEDWGFCLAHEDYVAMDRSVRYHVVVDTKLFDGALTLGERLLPGTSGQEYLIHTYCCHPSMGNDNLSGVILWALLLRELAAKQRRHSYRFVIAPETIGALAYLDMRREEMASVNGGFVLSTVAGPGPFSLKASFLGNTPLDRYSRHILALYDKDFIERPFDVMGSDERQYSSPGFRIPMITIARSQYHHYPEYHTSLDNLDFISAESLMKSLEAHLDVIDVLERNAVLTSLSPYGEPMLGKRDLYPRLGGALQTTSGANHTDQVRDTLWTMFLADGQHTQLDVAERAGRPFEAIADSARVLENVGLIRLTCPTEDRK